MALSYVFILVPTVALHMGILPFTFSLGTQVRERIGEFSAVRSFLYCNYKFAALLWFLKCFRNGIRTFFSKGAIVELISSIKKKFWAQILVLRNFFPNRREEGLLQIHFPLVLPQTCLT